MVHDESNPDVEVFLQPLDPEIERARMRIREPQFDADELTEATREHDHGTRVQYGIRELLLATTVMAFGLATLQFVAPTALAFVIGLITLGAIIGINIYEPETPNVRRAAWCLVLTYVLVALVALWRE
ncbi:MAG: hypothetical protein KDB23_29910 [Planctomycetales bacterium]|nr:hypothetical protein [Planctomycetales bacterium]